MKTLQILFFTILYLNTFSQVNDKNFNGLIDCKSTIYDNDFKIIICKNNQRINRINEKNSLMPNTLYFINYDYDQALNRNPKDTITYLLNSNQIDSINFLLDRIINNCNKKKISKNQKFKEVRMYDGLTTNIILDYYNINKIYQKFDPEKNDKLEILLNYLRNLLMVKIDY